MLRSAVAAGMVAVGLVPASHSQAQPAPQAEVPRGVGDVQADPARVWTHYIPGLATRDFVLRERHRRMLVSLGSSVVPELTLALDRDRLVAKLREDRQLRTSRVAESSRGRDGDVPIRPPHRG